MKHFCNAFAVLLAAICTASTASALPLVWRADWPDAKPVETLVHRGTDIELQPLWRINKEPADTNGWTFTTFCQTNAVGPWFGPLPGACFSHTNDIGAAFYNVMVRAQTPGGAVNYTAFARLRMLDSPGFAPGKLPLQVSTIDFSEVVALHAPWTLQTDFSAATNTLSSAIGGLAQNLATVSNAAVNAAITNALQDAALADHIKGATNPHKVTAEQVGAYTKKETDSQISNAIGNIQFPVPYVPTKVSELDNDAGYVTDSVTNGLISKEYVDRKDAATLQSFVESEPIDIRTVAQDVAAAASDDDTRTVVRRLPDDLRLLRKQAVADIQAGRLRHRIDRGVRSHDQRVQKTVGRLFVKSFKQLAVDSGIFCGKVDNLGIIKRDPQFLRKTLAHNMAGTGKLPLEGVNR